MPLKSMDLSFLHFLSRVPWSRDLLWSLLCDPRTAFLESLSPSRFKTQFQATTKNLEDAPQLRVLLERHLLVHYLLRRPHVPKWFFRFVEATLDLNDHLPGMDWKRCGDGSWTVTPLLLVGEKVHLRWLVVGCMKQPPLPPFPPWVHRLMDPGARAAVTDAMVAVGADGRNFHRASEAFTCFPLAAAHDLRITGPSLGLSTALACLFLKNGGEGVMAVAAAGTVQKDGAIGPVGQLPEKIAHGEKRGFRVMVVPGPDRFPPDRPGMAVLPAVTLEEAWLLVSLHEPGQANRLHLFDAMLKHPRTFVDNCLSIPTEWLLWAKSNGRTEALMAEIRSSESLFKQLVHHMGGCLRDGRTSHGETLVQLADFAGKGHDDSHPGTSLSFQWAMVNLALANHRGVLSDSRRWADKARDMVAKASVTDLKAFAAFYNYGFVGLRHNQYRFAPELPGPLAGLLSSLEAMHRAQCRILPGSVNRTLGALYGSMGQNFGFCGPSSLSQTRKYATLAMDAFGDDPAAREDRRRQTHCMVYALMDAGRFREAEKTLLAYLDMTSWATLGDRLPEFQKWEHAVLARFLADFRPMETCSLYGQWVEGGGGPMVRKTHPWQLWLNNMGRLMRFLGRREAAVFFFKESLDLCLFARFGPTVRVMALLPLAGLRKSEALKGLRLNHLEETLRNAADALNPFHFQEMLNEKDFLKTLDRVWENPSRFFPFTYR